METISYQGRMLLALVLLAWQEPLAAQAKYQGEKNWHDVCTLAAAKPVTAPTVANPKTESDLKSCDSTRLYYGFDGRRDYGAALECAYYERAHDTSNGNGVLSMLYANGLGVKRDYDLAIRFACENGGADAEMEGRIGHLESMRDSHSTATNFDLCDDITSGLMEGACASIGEELAKAKRAKRLKLISTGWPPAAKDAFAALQQAELEFAEAHGGKEIDLSGSGRAAFSIEAEAKVHDQFVADLEVLAKGSVPELDYQKEDAKLNAAYRSLIAARGKDGKDDKMPGSVEVSGIRETERVWIKYRDAWMAFGKVAYPEIGAERIGGWISRQRIGQLKEVE